MRNTTDKDIKILIEKAKEGDKDAQAMIVEENLGLVWSIVKRFLNRGFEPEDLFQIGCIGLIKCIKKFDVSYGVKFSTYAVPMILGEIKRFIRDDGIIKVSRSIKEISSRVRITKEVMAKELGREPSINEIAERMKLKTDDIIIAMDVSYIPESLNDTAYEGDEKNIELIDMLSSSQKGIDLEDRIALKQLLMEMDNRERQIIVLRYFKEKTQSQVAVMLGISQVQVSRIEKKILTNMRKKILEG
ncbi:MAG: RNA polymerase sporulation sigma factor SigF [Ignavibacteriales bacterium]